MKNTDNLWHNWKCEGRGDNIGKLERKEKTSTIILSSLFTVISLEIYGPSCLIFDVSHLSALLMADASVGRDLYYLLTMYDREYGIFNGRGERPNLF